MLTLVFSSEFFPPLQQKEKKVFAGGVNGHQMWNRSWLRQLGVFQYDLLYQRDED